MAGRKRQFGRIRKLPSGRYQVRYLGPDGVDRPAPATFRTKREAEVWLAEMQTEISQGDWLDPDAGLAVFETYGRTWIEERPNLRPSTLQLYRSLFRLHLVPTFGQVPLRDINEAAVRQWRKRRLDAGVGATTVAKSYRLLRAILGTAVDDGVIRRNPCRIKGAAVEHAPERPVLTLPDVFRLADAIEPRFRVLVLLAVFAGLRWGELAALRRGHLDLDYGRLHVRESVTVLRDYSRVTGVPKSRAGVRTVHLPEFLVDELRVHLRIFAQQGANGLVFVGAKGAPLARPTFSRPWKKALAKADLAGIRVHDLRHTGNTLAAPGTSLRELMARMGHSTPRAALIYQHATSDRDRLIAAALEELARAAREKDGKDGDDGAASAPVLV